MTEEEEGISGSRRVGEPLSGLFSKFRMHSPPPFAYESNLTTMPTSSDGPARPRILIVDDDPASRRLLMRPLERDYDVIECQSGSETLQLLEGAGAALVVLDYQMPDLNGAQVCELIRSSRNSEVAQSPIIMLTGHSHADHEVECLKAGANDFVTKPVNLAVLRARIDPHLHLHAMRKQLLAQNLELEKWRGRQEEDLEAARLTQQAILPSRHPTLDGWNFGSNYHPLMQIGGDMYDWLRIPDGSLLVWISDATGHGASAALLTTLSKLLFRHAAAEAQHPAGIMDYVEREFQAIFRAHTYMTAACLLINHGTGRVAFCGAGQPPLLIVRGTGRVDSIRSTRPPLGLHKVGGSVEEHRHLDHGEALLLYTDGLYEIQDPAGRRLGLDGLINLISPPDPETAAEWLTRIIKQSTSFAESVTFPDDIAAFAAVRE
jgi:sigma-B regulation protein RsbU (phosphoserine phosphatase)